MAVSPAAQLSPSLMPPLHLLLVGLQTAQGWMKVLHEPPPGQSASVMHPKLAFEPPAQLPVSQVPDPAQSPSPQHGVSAACPPPLAQRPVSLTHVPPPGQALVVPQPPLPVQFDPGL